MTATAHALVGGAIAAALPDNPALGISLSALSHQILDMIPHWDFGQGWKKMGRFFLFAESIFDLSLGIFLAFVFFGQRVDQIYLIIVIFFAEVWDVFMMPYLLFNWKFPPFSTFYNVQHGMNSKIRLPWGILTQVVTIVGVVFALRFVH